MSACASCQEMRRTIQRLQARLDAAELVVAAARDMVVPADLELEAEGMSVGISVLFEHADALLTTQLSYDREYGAGREDRGLSVAPPERAP